jgi:hypothetical protein
MSFSHIPKAVRASLLTEIEAEMEKAADRWRAAEADKFQLGQSYWVGVEDGLNKVFRYLSIGEWET